MNACWCPFPVGRLLLAEEDGYVTHIDFGGEPPAAWNLEESPVLRRTCAELAEYFAGERRVFTVPLAPRGTEFQTRVWDALRAIPYGETRSYRQIAEAVGQPKACRAVGMANHRNPISILIPCHRVIGANGSLVGYGGGLDLKTWLLRLERAV